MNPQRLIAALCEEATHHAKLADGEAFDRRMTASYVLGSIARAILEAYKEDSDAKTPAA